MNKFKFILALFMVFFILGGCNSFKKVTGSPCVSNSSSTPQWIVESAACALEQMREETDGPSINYLLEMARGVFIFPDVYKAAFMVGAEGGPGVLCAKDDTGFWNGPAFFNMAGVNIGLQGGVAGKTVVVFLMDKEALDDALGGKIDLSMGADLAIGHLNDSSHRGSFDVQGNLFTLVYQAGMFSGMAYRTGALMVSNDYNKKYYGQAVDVRDILKTHKYDKPEADVLLMSLLGI
ncbi:lipid-binding SYLF domain-containing protein [Maridesulfovibrio sp.]|uniref:lipid-binding SYLF domain-containing protein n=1 Tax=Maridesulfovibrio sp. TaxID=2795000 RepID=UPI002A18CFD8|nr:lipid-binding SYLF domain-containing protein [Maridesulfovibrio sp.]